MDICLQKKHEITLFKQNMDVLVFYSKSSDVPPGRGVHERVGNPAQQADLRDLPDWRKALSNFDTSTPFVWTGSNFDFLARVFPSGTTWRTIEHAFQAAKIAIADTNQAQLFTMNSGSAIGLGDGAIAQKNRKLVKLNFEQLALWDSISRDVMADIAKAKQANRNSFAARVLKATRNAELVHLMKQRGKPSVLDRFRHLESIRALL